MPNTTHVAIIGGGVAGLAAAAKLAEKGIETTILEASSQLGGRARSVSVEYNSQVVQLDNGQHILLGAYHETLKLLEQVNIPEDETFLRLPLKLETHSLDDSPAFKLTTPAWLPFPLNQLIGFLFCKGLSLGDRFSVIKFMLHLKRVRYQTTTDEPLEDYLKKQHQSDRTITLLWEPLCLSALNTPIHVASSKVFLNVLKDAFTGGKSNSDMLLPKRDLSKIFAQPITRYVKAREGHVLTNHRVRSIRISKTHGFKLLTKKGVLEFSHVVIATSALRLQDLIIHLPKLKASAEATANYRHQPIYTIYLQYPNDVKLPEPMIGLTGTLSQWVFDRGALCGQHGLIAVIISAEGRHQTLDQEMLALTVANELREAFPTLTKPLWHRVIAEKRATFSCEVGLTRPANSTRYPNLYIAGDYTYADYPATIEGAVRSGVNVANMIKR